MKVVELVTSQFVALQRKRDDLAISKIPPLLSLWDLNKIQPKFSPNWRYSQQISHD
ncbi:MAG: hypothetical protein V7L01_23420 [Nostoc sp.]|uniref:hypothetical protein n=1 Tax=Nostoc sp. TaxID=1180 RepID=UPI002FF6B4DF